MGAFRSFFTPNEVIFEGERSEKRIGKRLYRVFILYDCKEILSTGLYSIRLCACRSRVCNTLANNRK